MDSVYIYVRWSSKKQEKGDSKERQTNACLGHAQAKGWTLSEPFFGDYGVSAWKGDHLKTGRLGWFADRVRSGEIPGGSILLVEALDRLSRQEWQESLSWVQAMTKLGLRIATVQGDRIYDQASLQGSEGIVSFLDIMMKGQSNNNLSEVISTRLKSSWVKRRAAAAQGHIISAHVPGWLEVVDQHGQRTFRTIPDRVETVRTIYQMAADGMGARSIARTLNERGVPPFGKPHNHVNSRKPGWEHTYIADILAAPSVEGDYEPKIGRHKAAVKTGERFAGYFGEAIVDADLVSRARAGVASRKGRGGRGRTQVRNLFADLIQCGKCGAPMSLVGNSAKPARYLQCRNASGGRGCDQKRTFAYVPFETAALDALLPLALDDRHFTRPDHSHAIAVKLAEANKAIEAKKADEARLVEILLRTESEAVEGRLKLYEQERKAMEAAREKLQIDLAASRGAVSPQEHMKRVLEVRDALNHSDDETRLAARRKVAQAIAGLFVQVKCNITPEGEKSFVLYVMNGSLMFFIDHQGNQTTVLDLMDPGQLGGLFGMTDEDIREFRDRCEHHHTDQDEGWASTVEFETFKRRRVALIEELKRPLAVPVDIPLP